MRLEITAIVRLRFSGLGMGELSLGLKLALSSRHILTAKAET